MKLRALSKRIIFALILFFISVTPAFAQTNPALTPNANPDVPKNLHTHTQNVMIEVMASMLCQLTGQDVINRNQTCLGVDQQTGKIGFMPPTDQGKIGGAIGATTNVIGLTYTPPLHTGDYISYLTQNFGITKPAYAATTGTGFDSLNPIMNLWIAFRNLVYFFFIAIFVVLGFGIMLRVHMDPRTVMTISNQLPGIIVAILLVTFSFAISGFLIDLMWTSIYVTSNVITSVNKDDKNFQAAAQKVVQSTNVFEAANVIGQKTAENNGSITTIGGLTRIADDPAAAFSDQITPVFDNVYGKVVTGVIGFVIGSHLKEIGKTAISTAKSIGKGVVKIGAFLLGTTVSAGAGPAAPAAGLAAASLADSIFDVLFGAATATAAVTFEKNIVGWVVGLFAFLVIAIAILWALFRLAFELIKSYIFILLDVVFAPFWILGGLIPGSSIGFGAWMREIISHLSVFPVTIGMFLLGSAFMKAFGAGHTNQFVPPMVGNANAQNFAAFIGLGIILMTPQVLTMMKELIKAPSFKQTGSIAGALGFGLGAVNVPQQMQKLGMYGYYSGHLKDLPFGLGAAFGPKSPPSPPK